MIDHNDPRLTAYVLGELDETERQEIRAAMEASPVLQLAVRNIRETAGMLETEFAAELNGAVPAGKVALAGQSESATKHSFAGRRMAWIVVASLLVAATGLGLRAMQRPDHQNSGTLAQDSRDQINRAFEELARQPESGQTVRGSNIQSDLVGQGTNAKRLLASEATSRQKSLDEVSLAMERNSGYAVSELGGEGESGAGQYGAVSPGSGTSDGPVGPVAVNATKAGLEAGKDESKGFSQPGVYYLADGVQYPDGGTAVLGGIRVETKSAEGGADRMMTTPLPANGIRESSIINGQVQLEEGVAKPPSETKITSALPGIYGEKIAIVPNSENGKKLEYGLDVGFPDGNGRSAEEMVENLRTRVDPVGTREIQLNEGGDAAGKQAQMIRAMQKMMGGGGRRSDNLAGDRYEPIVENEFLRPSSAPLSTFSIDVDTASYSKVRMYLKNYRQLPPPGAVRIEELVNYFGYNYEPPTGDVPFAAHQSVSACPWNPQHKLVRVAIKGREIEQDKRPVSNLVFLLDVSGSMNESNKLPLVKRGIQMLIDQLSENDRVAMVVYAGAAGKVLDSTTGDHKDVIRGALDRLQAGGSTNGGDGIRLAYQIALDNFITGGVNRVILCTDGDFNVGTTSNEELVSLVEEKAKNNIFLSVLGFGMGNLNDSMLEQISNKGNGNYAFIDTDIEARKVLVEQMTGTLITIAKDVKIQVEFNPARVAAYRLVGYENRVMAAQDFNDDKKDAGEIGAGHTVTAIYEVVSPEIWKAQQTVEIALAGQFDLNFDGVDDREMLIQKIEGNEGKVVAWTDSEGAIQGSIKPTTRYLVVGEMPKADSGEIRLAQSIGELKEAARVNKTREIATVKLLEWLGAAKTKASEQPPVDDLKYQKVAEAKAVEDTGELLTLKLRFKLPEGDVSQLLTFPLMDSDRPFVESDRDFQFSAAVASFGMLLRGSKYAGQSSFDSILETAEAAAKGDKSGYRTEFLELVRIARELAGNPKE